MTDRTTITSVIDGTPAQQAGLRAGDEIIAADGTAFEPVGSFRGKVGRSVVLEVQRGAAVVQIPVRPVDLEPTTMFLRGLGPVLASLSPTDDASAMSMFGAMQAPSINALLNVCCRKVS